MPSFHSNTVERVTPRVGAFNTNPGARPTVVSLCQSGSDLEQALVSGSFGPVEIQVTRDVPDFLNALKQCRSNGREITLLAIDEVLPIYQFHFLLEHFEMCLDQESVTTLYCSLQGVRVIQDGELVLAIPTSRALRSKVIRNVTGLFVERRQERPGLQQNLSFQSLREDASVS